MRVEIFNAINNLPNLIRVIKSRMRWAGRLERMGREYMHTQFWWNNLRESDHLDDPSVNGKIILKGIFKTWDWVGMDWIELAQNRDKCGGGAFL